MSGKASGKASKASSFAERVTYFPMNVEEIPNNIEREFLLGGSGRPAAKANKGTIAAADYVYNRADKDDIPLPPQASNTLMLVANIAMLILGAALTFVCWYESRDSRNADEHCPLLYIGMIIGGIVIFVSWLGFLGIIDCCEQNERFTILYVYHTGTLLSMVLLVMLAVSTLIHWDLGGEVANKLFHNPETVGVRHRHLIWGVALACSLSVVAAIFGTLSSDWSENRGIYQWTTFTSSFFALVTGACLCIIFYFMEDSDELSKLAHPLWAIGSVIAGLAFALIGLYGLVYLHESEHFDPVKMHAQLGWFMGAVTVTASTVLFFSIANTVTAEPEALSDRRTHVLLSGLIGMWAQLNTCVLLTSASRWRHKYYEALQQAKTVDV